MLSRQALLRARTPALRNAIQRRFASTDGLPKLEGAMDNAFNRERQAVKAHAAKSAELWRKLSIYVCIPALVLASLNAYNLWNEHWEHWEHLPPLEERVEYPYQNIRTKNYFWGDGDKTLLARVGGSVTEPYLGPDLEDLGCEASRLWIVGNLTGKPDCTDNANKFCLHSWNDKVNYHKKEE